MKPSIGRIVITPIEPSTLTNGADEAPAVITRVWSDTVVNIRVLGDGEGHTYMKTSVTLHPDEDSARADSLHTCFWPPRV